MSRINIVLADTDELFLNQLTNYFIEKTTMFEVCAFSVKESLLRYVKNKDNKVDVIAISEEFEDEVISEVNIPVKIILADGFLNSVKEYEIINKYQKAEKLINAILILYTEKTGNVDAMQKSNKQTKTIGVYSPSHILFFAA